jgi:hypothetical protein
MREKRERDYIDWRIHIVATVQNTGPAARSRQESQGYRHIVQRRHYPHRSKSIECLLGQYPVEQRYSLRDKRDHPRSLFPNKAYSRSYRLSQSYMYSSLVPS